MTTSRKVLMNKIVLLKSLLKIKCYHFLSKMKGPEVKTPEKNGIIVIITSVRG